MPLNVRKQLRWNVSCTILATAEWSGTQCSWPNLTCGNITYAVACRSSQCNEILNLGGAKEVENSTFEICSVVTESAFRFSAIFDKIFRCWLIPEMLCVSYRDVMIRYSMLIIYGCVDFSVLEDLDQFVDDSDEGFELLGWRLDRRLPSPILLPKSVKAANSQNRNCGCDCFRSTGIEVEP